MKTDHIEIFQTIRASLQPYATLGFDNRTNSERVYDLWSNKNVEIDGSPRNEVFFVSVGIEDNHVALHLLPEDQVNELKKISDTGFQELLNANGYFEIVSLDDPLLAKIEEAIAAGFKIYKDKGWVV